MTTTIIGQKIGMTQVWDDDNNIVPVTVLRVEPTRIVQVRTPDRDGYAAIQVTWGSKDAGKLNQPDAGHFAAAGVDPGNGLAEFRVDDSSEYSVGQEISLETLEAGLRVDVTAVSRGKGFAGVMKRHNFKGQPASHGNHKSHRKPGAIGQCATPSRVFKGKKMAGRMGNEKVTIQNLKVVRSDAEQGVVLIKGAVPGARGAMVVVRDATKGGK